MKRIALTLPLLLAACMAEAPPDLSGTCPAPELQDLVGQGEDAIAGIGYDGPLRVIRPGMMVTMDYNPERLNIELDAAGRILRLTCG